MGLLDEAIREHLDLKRRRGADPAEVERAERDALGPVRRGPQEAIDSEPELSLAAPESFAYDQEGESQEWDGSFGEHPDPMPAGSDSDLGFEPAAAAESEQPRAFVDHLAFEDSPHLEERPVTDEPSVEAGTPQRAPEGDPASPPNYPAMPAPHPAGEPFGDETVEYRLDEHEHQGPPPSESEDVLEETPEFLQDAPEHDRLWFEQRPPRDFDFDG